MNSSSAESWAPALANSQIWLDPAEICESIPHPDPPSEQLPEEVRRFGFIPTFERLRPGDLLLVSAIKPGLFSRAIVKVQMRAGFDREHAQWHHAAVYVGNHMVCEAQRKGVVTSSIFTYAAGKHRLRFRRPETLDDLSSCRLALDAAMKLKYGYDLRHIYVLLKQAHIGWNRGSKMPRPLGERVTICSQLYADAYGVVTAMTLDPRAESGVSPAHLSAAKKLCDIPMEWLSLNHEYDSNVDSVLAASDNPDTDFPDTDFSETGSPEPTEPVMAPSSAASHANTVDLLRL